MKWAIVFYALFSVNGEPVEHISWGLTFPHHEKCIQFYTNNEQRLLSGINDFKGYTLPNEAVLTEVGCAHATADFDGPSENNVLSLKMPLWTGEQT